jgi:hypothetical protein
MGRVMPAVLLTRPREEGQSVSLRYRPDSPRREKRRHCPLVVEALSLLPLLSLL